MVNGVGAATRSITCFPLKSFSTTAALSLPAIRNIPILFWALRGGGGNFGVVTSFQYALHHIGPVWAGFVAHPIDRLVPMLRFYREFVSRAADELTVHAAVMTLPTGDKVAAMLPVWWGDPSEGERRVAACGVRAVNRRLSPADAVRISAIDA